MLAAVAACNAHDSAKARAHLPSLSQSQRALVNDTCILANTSLEPPAPGTPVAPVGTVDCDKATEIFDAAKAAYSGGEFARSILSFEKYLACKPTDTAALSLATLAACSIGDAPKAKRLFARVPQSRRAMVASRCTQLGVPLR